MASQNEVKRIKFGVSTVCGILLTVRLIWPTLQVDAVALGLIFIAILPWLSPLIKSAELPGGLKVEFQEVREALQQITESEPAEAVETTVPDLSFLAIAENNPNLAVVGLRIEIEKRLRRLAELHGLTKSRPLTQIADELSERGVLKGSAAAGLKDLIFAGNQAAHGVVVDSDAASWAVEYGPKVIRILDKKITGVGGNPR